MKAIPRSGWITHGISLPDVESVAEHSFSTCGLALLLADLEAKRGKRVDVERVLRLAVLHDMAEALTFDISKNYLEYLGRKGEAFKREIERSAWRRIATGLDPTLRREYTRVQNEFEAAESFESELVHAADWLDILMQIIEYQRKGYPEGLLADLWDATARRLRSSDVMSARKVLAMLIQQRKRIPRTRGQIM